MLKDKEKLKQINFSPYLTFLKQKKAIVSLNTYALLLLVYLAIFLASYSFFYDSKLDSLTELKQKECLNSALSFRSNLIDAIKYPNSTLIYVNNYESDNIEFNITNNTISVKQELDSGLAEKNISSFGISFCSNYSFTESQNIVISYNGSCVSISN